MSYLRRSIPIKRRTRGWMFLTIGKCLFMAPGGRVQACPEPVEGFQGYYTRNNLRLHWNVIVDFQMAFLT